MFENFRQKMQAREAGKRRRQDIESIIAEKENDENFILLTEHFETMGLTGYEPQYFAAAMYTYAREEVSANSANYQEDVDKQFSKLANEMTQFIDKAYPRPSHILSNF